MRCKPGDLAVIVGGGFSENFGKVVLVNGPGRASDWDCDTLGQAMWGYCVTTSLPLCLASGFGLWVEFDDDELRPLRPDERADETLAWAGLPRPIVETVPS